GPAAAYRGRTDDQRAASRQRLEGIRTVGHRRAPPGPENSLMRSDYIGLRVARWRDIGGMTQQQLADAVGVTREYISMIENGKRPVTKTLVADRPGPGSRGVDH